MSDEACIPVEGAYPLRAGETMEIETVLTFDEDGHYSGGEARVTIEGTATKAATCTDCGGPLEPGRCYRCVACTDAEWQALEHDKGAVWVGRHREEDAQ